MKASINLRTEILAGVTTFCTMAYVIMVNPMLLHSTGMDYGAVFVATCLSAAFGSLLMGLLGNYPIALAPSMGLNAYFTYFVVQQLHFSWQQALGTVFIAGILFALITFAGVRQWLINGMPHALKLGICAGIGLFLAVIGLKNLGVIAPHFHLALLFNIKVLLCLSGLCLMIVLSCLRVLGTILLGIFAITVAGILLGLTHLHGFVAKPPSLLPTLLQLQLPHHLQMVPVILVFLFVMLFDNTGTLIAVLQQANLLEKENKTPRLGRALFADSTATIMGSLLGTSPTGSYIESAAGVRAGGRTGVTSIVVAILFLGALFFAPLAAAIPEYATAAALLFVAGLMLKNLMYLPWRDLTESLPALITVLVIPLTFSIADGVSAAFISYVVLKTLCGKAKELNLGIWSIALLCVVYAGLEIF
jgi:adenine/guanine/hypoxanthine permease